MAKDRGIVERVQQTIDRVREFGEGKDEDYGTATAVIRDARDAIAEARTAGADVSGLRAQLPGLEQKARRFYADKAVDRVSKLGEGKSSGYITPDTAIRDARNAIAEAKSAGAGVFDLESRMPEMEAKAWHCAAKNLKAG
jgi:ABC-type proline/glycine betaine transport system substrate-binding protein